MVAEAEITSGNNINAATDSVRPGQPLPTGDGVERRRHLQLYQAALSGDWDTAEGIYESFPGEVNARITKRGETALHIAAAAEHTHFVKQLVGKMSIEALTYKNEAGNTAFCFAAISGVEALANVMMETGRDLAMTRGRENLLPIYMAALLGHRGMVSYLYDETKEQLTDSDRITLLVALINSDIYDVALRILKAHPGLAYARDEHQLTALHALAQKSCMPSNVVDQSPPGFWYKCLDPCFKLAQMKKLMHKQELDLIQNLWEQVIFKVDQNTYSIFHIAILNRHEDIFKMIYQIGSIKNVMTIYKDREGNNMLHLASKVLESPSRLNVIPGAALQLQRELLWVEVDYIGLTTLFISIEAMMGAFTAAFFLVVNDELPEYSIPIVVVASLPIIFFIWQHYRLFLDMIHSTYTSRSLSKPHKSPLFSKRVKPKGFLGILQIFKLN
ncbi:hypothetical protein POTOM_024909 [Populus tomentosa]|uniref:Ankyrin repeat family protein n=1 Tax=Populus tomentosa TaxID=118781 RepID=A0A8X7ZG77_POPTO|nr:hypothetical protein POTOM_024909 [Populus tomentosa]